MTKSVKVPRARGDVIKTYPLRDIPVDLWRSAKIAAAERGLKLRDLLLMGLKSEIEKK